MKRKAWTATEEAVLIAQYGDSYTGAISEQLGRSYGSTVGRARKLGLKKTADFYIKAKAMYVANLKKYGMETRFAKGAKPMNKGLKQADFMSAEAIARTAKSRFKKGAVPYNIKYDGHERLCKDGYVLIRVAVGLYEYKHRWLWAQLKGAIPAGSIVAFKDGNKKNVHIDNLELRSRAENMQRNSVRQYPEVLQESIKLLNKLNKKIHEK